MTPPKGQRLGGRRPPEPTSTRTDPPAPTAPETPEETPADPPAPKPATEVPGQMDKRVKAFWRTNLQNSARKLARDRAQVLASEDAWVDTVTDARDAGVPENVILAAAADADVELPE